MNLLYASFPWMKGRTFSLWDSLLLSGSLCPAPVAILSRWHSRLHQSCRSCLDLIVLSSLVPTTLSYASLRGYQGQAILFTLYPSFTLILLVIALSNKGSLTLTPLSVYPCYSPCLDTLSSFWHRNWTQATFSSVFLDYLILLTLNSLLSFFSSLLSYFRKLDCDLTIRWLGFWGQRFECSISRPQNSDPMHTWETQLAFAWLTPIHPWILGWSSLAKGSFSQ